MDSGLLLADNALLRLRGAGHEVQTDARYVFDCATRIDVPQLTIQLTLAGACFYEDQKLGRRLVEVGAAFSNVIPSSFRYGYPPEAKVAYEHVFVSMSGPAAFEWHRRINDDFGAILDLGPAASLALVPQMLEIAHAHSRGDLPDRYVQSSRLYQILMTIYSVMRTREVQTRPRVTQALNIINLQASDPAFSIEQLADILDCSREHLTREFRAATGQSPLGYLNEHRLRHAARLLRADDTKLDVIARASGFSGANYFCRAFRKRTGVSPGEFRTRRSLTLG